MMKQAFSLATVLLLGVSSAALAGDNEVFTWKSGGSTVYSDTPNKMRMGESSVVNVRTRTVTPPETKPDLSKLSLAERQALLSQEIAEQNKAIEEANAKVVADAKAENCKLAQMNLRNMQESNAKNKDQLVPRYQEAVNKFCN